MIEKCKKLLDRKHLLIIGKSETERRRFINELIDNVHYTTFRFPSRMRSFDEYVDFVKKAQLY